MQAHYCSTTHLCQCSAQLVSGNSGLGAEMAMGLVHAMVTSNTNS